MGDAMLPAPTPPQVVGWGSVPLLVRLLQKRQGADTGGCSSSSGSSSKAAQALPRAQLYALATLQQLALHEPRHADVVCR